MANDVQSATRAHHYSHGMFLDMAPKSVRVINSKFLWSRHEMASRKERHYGLAYLVVYTTRP